MDRRGFISRTSLGILAAAVGAQAQSQQTPDQPAGAPPAFGTAPAVGPEITPNTFAEAEKLVQVQLTPAERAEAVAALAAATDLLDHHLKRERIAAVVRRKSP